MKTNEILETIDCTPTWQSLLLPMLDLYAQKVYEFGYTNPHSDERKRNKDTRNNLISSFKDMAKAADKWNEHCKTL